MRGGAYARGAVNVQSHGAGGGRLCVPSVDAGADAHNALRRPLVRADRKLRIDSRLEGVRRPFESGKEPVAHGVCDDAAIVSYGRR